MFGISVVDHCSFVCPIHIYSPSRFASANTWSYTNHRFQVGMSIHFLDHESTIKLRCLIFMDFRPSDSHEIIDMIVDCFGMFWELKPHMRSWTAFYTYIETCKCMCACKYIDNMIYICIYNLLYIIHIYKQHGHMLYLLCYTHIHNL